MIELVSSTIATQVFAIDNQDQKALDSIIDVKKLAQVELINTVEPIVPTMLK